MKKEEKKTYSDEFLKDVQGFADFAIRENEKDKRRTKVEELDKRQSPK